MSNPVISTRVVSAGLATTAGSNFSLAAISQSLGNSCRVYGIADLLDALGTLGLI